MATIARPVAKCVVRWLYEQASWVLEQLKKQLLRLIKFIDAQIAWLRAQAAQWDLLAMLEQYIWDSISAFIEALKNELASLPNMSPFKDHCPELAQYFTDPLIGLLDTFINSFLPAHENLNSMLSYMDDLDTLIAYWNNTKQDLVAVIDIIDAALYEILWREAETVP